MSDIVERLREVGLLLQQPERERMADEIERLRATIANLEARFNTELLKRQGESMRLRAALQRIGHETGETMRATNHGRRGDIANEIAAAALAKAGGKE